MEEARRNVPVRMSGDSFEEGGVTREKGDGKKKKLRLGGERISQKKVGQLTQGKKLIETLQSREGPYPFA